MPHWLRRVTALVISASLFALLAWYSISFLPHLADLKEISLRGSDSVKNIEGVLYPLAVASESRDGLRLYAARQAYYSLVHEKNPGRMFVWHANNVLWYTASYLHFNDYQSFCIWVQCALSGCSHNNRGQFSPCSIRSRTTHPTLARCNPKCSAISRSLHTPVTPAVTIAALRSAYCGTFAGLRCLRRSSRAGHHAMSRDTARRGIRCAAVWPSGGDIRRVDECYSARTDPLFL